MPWRRGLRRWNSDSSRALKYPPNENNAAAGPVALKNLVSPVEVIPRNVKDCWNLGYCGMGCPTNAKQSMPLTTIPSALGSRRHADFPTQGRAP